MRYYWLIFVLVLVMGGVQANEQKTTSFNITHSLYGDGKKHGLSVQTLATIARALSWKINFNTLRKNDKFIIIGSHKIKPDAVIFKRGRKALYAFLWRGQYFDKNGKSWQGGFLKAPLKYSRISSPFQLKRYHPILKTYLPHRAIDYVANFGMPVVATANGVIKKRKNIGALGNAVFIKHGLSYESVYAHLSYFAKGLRRGQQVKQGQIIGYVGSTGRSTGAHLHYEIRHNGKRKNPATHKLPQQTQLNKNELLNFKNTIKTLWKRYLNLI